MVVVEILSLFLARISRDSRRVAGERDEEEPMAFSSQKRWWQIVKRQSKAPKKRELEKSKG